jgi:hypothetical protein
LHKDLNLSFYEFKELIFDLWALNLTLCLFIPKDIKLELIYESLDKLNVKIVFRIGHQIVDVKSTLDA